MQFKDIIGHKELIATLKKNADENRLPHAMLLSEQHGRGALPIALALIQYLFCKKRREATAPLEDSCNECSSCFKIRELSHSDLHFLFPINATEAVAGGKKAPQDMYYNIFRSLAKQNPYFSEEDLYKAMGLEGKMGLIGADEATWLLNKLSFSAYEGGCKVVLILYPERMNATAANKLLKSIEEPTGDTYFFLITNAPSKIIQTIRSRCRLIEIPPIEGPALSKAIAERFQIPDSQADTWAKVAFGSFGNALKLMGESREDEEDTELFFSLIDSALQGKITALLDMGEALAKKNKEAQKMFCKTALKLLREGYIYKINLPQISYCNPKKEAKLKEIALHLREDFFDKGYELFNSAIECVESQVNAKMLFCDLCNSIYLKLQQNG